MKTNLLRMLRVEPKETKIVFFMVLFAFCLGVAENIVCSISLSMFLAHYSSSLLTYVYIGAGLAMFFAGLAFSFLEVITSIFYVLAIPTAIFSGSLFLFWSLLFVIQNPLIFMALQIWSVLLISFMVSILLLLSNQLFTLQQSKRLFGLIFAGKAIGGMIIGFGMDYFVKSIGSQHLILLSSFSLFFILITQFFIKRHSGSKLLKTEKFEKVRASTPSLIRIYKHKHVFYVFILTILVFFISYSFDLLFNTEVQAQFPDEDKMAAFYGALYAVYDIIGLILGLFVFPWMLLRWGLNATLLFWPMTLTILLSLMFFTNVVPPLAMIVFPLFVMTALFEVPFLEAIIAQSILLLFQPLRLAHRTWAQLKNEVLIIPLSISVVGCILLGINHFFGVQVAIMSPLIVGLSLIVVALLFLNIKKEYLMVLAESLSKRAIVNPKFTILDKESLNILKEHLKSQYPEEVIYVLQTLEQIDQKELIKILRETLDFSSEEVRCFSLNKIEQFQIKDLKDRLEKICATETNPAILSCAIRALGSMADLNQFPWFQNCLQNSNPQVVGNSIDAMIQYGSNTEKTAATELLVAKAKSTKNEERLAAASALKLIDIPMKSELLLPLLSDSNLTVKVAASEAAAHGVDERVVLSLIENIAIPQLRKTALNSLLLLGSPAIEYITQNFNRLSLDIQMELIRLLGLTKEAKASEFLQNLLPSASVKSLRPILRPILRALKRHSYEASQPAQRKIIDDLLKANNSSILRLVKLANEKAPVLQGLLFREIELCQECCFYLLSFIYPKKSIFDVQKGLLSEDEDKKSNAVELLFHILSNEDKNLLFAQLTPHKKESNEEEVEKSLVKTMDEAPNYFISGIAAAVIYTIGTLQLSQLLDLVNKQKSSADPLMQETVTWTLKKLEKKIA